MPSQPAMLAFASVCVLLTAGINLVITMAFRRMAAPLEEIARSMRSARERPGGGSQTARSIDVPSAGDDHGEPIA